MILQEVTVYTGDDEIEQTVFLHSDRDGFRITFNTPRGKADIQYTREMMRAVHAMLGAALHD